MTAMLAASETTASVEPVPTPGVRPRKPRTPLLAKLLAGAACAGVLGAAEALPITDVFVPESVVTLTTGVPYFYQHDLLAHGFDPLLDLLSSASLTVDITGPGGQNLSVAFDSTTVFNGTLNAWLAGEPFAVQLGLLQSDGLLSVGLTKTGGGSTFSFAGSTLVAQGVSGQDPIGQLPEPGLLALLGTGLVGLMVSVRRRRRD